MEKNKSKHPAFDEGQYLIGVAQGMMNHQIITLVLKADGMRNMDTPVQNELLDAFIPERNNPSVRAMLLRIKDRFEYLVRDGKSTTEALNLIREEGLLNKYENLVNPAQEIH
ncbi:hypothetical protein [Neptuniibacter marinus]|uniref:hypothetical protein n=1 Tax=Neptuniibacter marinus TaxID=1806670 RepID=UPI003B5999BE